MHTSPLHHDDKIEHDGPAIPSLLSLLVGWAAIAAAAYLFLLIVECSRIIFRYWIAG